MSLHDEYARVTPFEVAFPDGAEVEALVEEIREEASGRGVDPSLPGVFHTLGSVDDFVRRILPPDAPGPAVQQYAALVFQAAHFVGAGRPVYLLRTKAVRSLVEGAPSAEPRPPGFAGYLQLPQHLVWMSVPENEVPESLDGLFWTATTAGALHVLPVTGLLPEQASFRALPLPEVPLADAPAWVEADMRAEGRDYASSLPGHDLDRLYSVETAGEVLKLLARFFSHLEADSVERRHVESAGSVEPVASPTLGPRPSALPFTSVGVRA